MLQQEMQDSQDNFRTEVEDLQGQVSKLKFAFEAKEREIQEIKEA